MNGPPLAVLSPYLRIIINSALYNAFPMRNKGIDPSISAFRGILRSVSRRVAGGPDPFPGHSLGITAAAIPGSRPRSRTLQVKGHT